MKKSIALLLAVVMVCLLCACGNAGGAANGQNGLPGGQENTDTQFENLDINWVDDNWGWSLQEGVLTICGKGDMPDFSSELDVPWQDRRFEIDKVVIQDGITSIGTFSFCEFIILNDISIPNSVTRIGKGAFMSCTSLPSIVIPENVTTIEESVFSNCNSLADVTLPDGITTIGDKAFAWCGSLTDVNYPGTQEQWAAITIGADNEALTSAQLHFGA